MACVEPHTSYVSSHVDLFSTHIYTKFVYKRRAVKADVDLLCIINDFKTIEYKIITNTLAM